MMQKLKNALEQSTKKAFRPPRARSVASDSYSPTTQRFRELSGIPSGNETHDPTKTSFAGLLAAIASSGHDYEKQGANKELLDAISQAKQIRHDSLASFLEKVPNLWEYIQHTVQKDAVRHQGNASNIEVPGIGRDTHSARADAVIKPTLGIDLHASTPEVVNGALYNSENGIGLDTPHAGKYSFSAINTGLHHHGDDAAQFILQSLHNIYKDHVGDLPSAVEMVRDHVLDTRSSTPTQQTIPGLMSIYRQTRPWGIHSVQQLDANNVNRITKHPQMTTLFGDHNADNAFMGHNRDALLAAQIHAKASHQHLMNSVLGFHNTQSSGGRHYLSGQREFNEMNGAHMRYINSLAINLVGLGLRGDQLKSAIRLGSHVWADDWHKEKGEEYKLGRNSAPSSPIIWKPEHATWHGAHAAWGKSTGLTPETLNLQPEPWRKEG